MNSTYLIGEIGQNHNGSIDVAKKIIDVLAEPVIDKLFGKKFKGFNAVKLTKRDLKEELSSSQMLRPYTGEHSYGKTYGEHRAYLELNDEEHFEIYKYARQKGFEFIETLCAKGCLSMLKHFSPDRLKVASRDLTNIPLLEALAETKIPMIISTGMAGASQLDDALAVITKYHSEISILHCLSQYPSEYENINLNTIPYLIENYPEYTIGYSDHSIGIVVPAVAVALGAKIIEKHITLDRNMKGTDHKMSLGPDGIHRMTRDIRNIELSLGSREIFLSEAVTSAREKLERSIATRRGIKKGEILKETDLHMLSPGDGYKWSQRDKVIGREAIMEIKENEIIYPNMLVI
jgi:sialic acid synthase